MNRKVLVLIGALSLTISWLLLIFNFSAMTSQDSSNASTGLTEKLISKVLDATNEAGITDSHPDDAKLAKAAKLINAPIRKVAHATVYFVLALTLLAVGRAIFGGHKYLITCALALLFCFIFAMTDEYVGILLSSSYFLVWKFGRNSATQMKSPKVHNNLE